MENINEFNFENLSRLNTEIGEIVSLDTKIENKCIRSKKDSNPIIGVRCNIISENCYVCDIGCETVCILGITKAKVIGRIDIGEYITLSDIPGIGIGLNRVSKYINTERKIVGIALENKTYNDIGLVQILIK